MPSTQLALPTPAWLVALAPGVVDLVAAVAGDLILAVDAAGVVREMFHGTAAPPPGGVTGWRGQPWVATSMSDTRGKAERAWRELCLGAPVRQRQINHAADDGRCVPVAWSGLRVDAQGTCLLLGRDLGPAHALQQELLATQAALETARWKAYSSPSGASPRPNRRSLT